jgi:hypothetical protein
MQAVRQYIRELILETRFKQMSKDRFTGLKPFLQSADFVNAEAGGDFDENDTFFTEAQQTLIEELNDYFGENFPPYGNISVTVKVDMMSTSPDEGVDKALKGATYFYDGLHNVELMIAQMEDGHTLSEFGDVANKAYEVITHELLHMQQFMKYSRGEPTEEKWTKFMAEYKKRGGASGMGGDYFFFDQEDGASELETFSLQMANELVNALGQDEAVKLLQMQNPDYDTIREKSASFRDIERKSPGAIERSELRDMIKRAKQYAKRM